MKEIIHRVFSKHHIWITFYLLCFAGIIAGVVFYGEYRRSELNQQLTIQTEKLASTTSIFTEAINGLQTQIADIVDQNNLLSSTVQEQMNQTSDLLDQVGQVADTAEALDKLSKVDPQLLQKYSKVFFLNENYSPEDLTTISKGYSWDNKTKYEVLSNIYPHLESMLQAADDDNIDIKIISAYRSFDTQASLKSTYQIIYGAGTANQFSADQGYSEHQLGTTLDFTNSVLKDNYDTFDQTPAYSWLVDNAYKFGFILSYPKGNSYYIYEPWHWRFVGEDLAYRLHRLKKNFYDMDQRTINNYLGVFFD